MEEMGLEGSLEGVKDLDWGEKKEKVARPGACEALGLTQWGSP